MKKENLIALGLTEELVSEVMDIYKKDLKGYIPKKRFDEVNDSRKDLEKQIEDKNEQLISFEEKIKSCEEAEKIIKKLQQDNESAKKFYAAKIKDMTITSAIQSKLMNVKYSDLLVDKFDKSILVVNEDGTVSGIDEQLTILKKQYKDLFIIDTKDEELNCQKKSSEGVKNPWSMEHFNLAVKLQV
ncbi:phage scaffolding protein [Anaerocolumna sp.]|uniref:phage scaffolding protein n=1 Tax=Anaerocolumna sp. TaxID=2041569 RepID=UPI0028AD39EC|nr:phage scaffolding protein [Anaerocolumna sp.]